MINYLVAFGLEIVGICLVYWDGVPLFRQLLKFEQSATKIDEATLFAAVILIQFTYWTKLQHNPPFSFKAFPFAAHVVLFISRLNFIFASAVFSLVVYRYPEMFEFGIVRTTLMAAVLFSVFCFTRHLEKLGQLMLTGYIRTK